MYIMRSGEKVCPIAYQAFRRSKQDASLTEMKQTSLSVAKMSLDEI